MANGRRARGVPVLVLSGPATESLGYAELSLMKLRLTLPLLVLSLFAVGAVQQQYQSGRIVDIQRKVHTRVLYYLVNTPVTADDPYYEFVIQVQGRLYSAEFIPRHADDELPDEWKPDAEVQLHLERRHLFIKRPSGSDVNLTVVKSVPAVEGGSGPEREKK